MVPLPHRYVVTAVAAAAGEIALTSEGLARLRTDAPAEFDGPGNEWSPETMLVGSAADCFAITFRGVARASRLAWLDMKCEAIGTLDRVDGVMRFTALDLDVYLTLPEGSDEDLAQRVLQKVKRSCLITNSLHAEVRLRPRVETRTINLDGCSA